MSHRKTPPTDPASDQPEPVRPDPISPAQGIALAITLCIFLGGRGGTGKTLLLRWICERALQAGRAVTIADGDRTNRSLSHFFDEVAAPSSADDGIVWSWFEHLLQHMIAKRSPLIFDLGGGDLVLKQMALQLGLHGLLLQHDATPVMLHLLSPEVESLAYLASLEEDDLFAPERTALILNAGLVPRGYANDAAAFERVREHTVFKAAIRRGAVPIVMPRLIPAHEINARHLSFGAATEAQPGNGLPPLGLFDRQRTLIWLREMELAFAPIAAWLP